MNGFSELILGGVKSGKSAYAQRRAESLGKSVVYVATARVYDNDMRKRVEAHQATRPATWLTVEEPEYLGSVLRDYAENDRIVLVDCLTLWLSQILFRENGEIDEGLFQKELASLEQFLMKPVGSTIFVSNEIGLGIIGATAETRRFADEAGKLNQMVAEYCRRVILMSAGIPLPLKHEE